MAGGSLWQVSPNLHILAFSLLSLPQQPEPQPPSSQAPQLAPQPEPQPQPGSDPTAGRHANSAATPNVAHTSFDKRIAASSQNSIVLGRVAADAARTYLGLL